MPLTNNGRDAIAAMLIGEAVTPFDNTFGYLGVGNGNTAFAAAQVDLQGASKLRHALDAAYPQRAGNVLTFRSLFSTVEANFAWEEWGIFNDALVGVMLSRKAETLGSKTSAQSWLLTVVVTVESVP